MEGKYLRYQVEYNGKIGWRERIRKDHRRDHNKNIADNNFLWKDRDLDEEKSEKWII